jgi:hypothetical protein
MLIDHSIENGIYRVVISDTCIILIYFRDGLAQGRSINIDPLSNTIIGTGFYHNGLLLSQNDMTTVYTNRRVSRRVLKDLDENFVDGRLHGLYSTPSFTGTCDQGVLKGTVIYQRGSDVITMVLRKGIAVKESTFGAVRCLLDINNAIGFVTCHDIKSGKLVRSVNIDNNGHRHGKETNENKISWYWHNRPIEHTEFIALYNKYTKAIKDSTVLLPELSDMVTQYLH